MVRSDGRISPTPPPSTPTGFRSRTLHGASFLPISFPAVPVSTISVPLPYCPPLTMIALLNPGPYVPGVNDERFPANADEQPDQHRVIHMHSQIGILVTVLKHVHTF